MLAEVAVVVAVAAAAAVMGGDWEGGKWAELVALHQTPAVVHLASASVWPWHVQWQ